MKDEELLRLALSSFARLTGVAIRVVYDKDRAALELADSPLTLDYQISQQVEEVLKSEGVGMGNPARRPFARSVWILPYVSGPQAQQLRSAGVEFLDSVGNAYIVRPEHRFLIIIQGQDKPGKPYYSGRSLTGSISFAWSTQAKPALVATPKPIVEGSAAIYLLYALLTDPDLLRAPYRTQAARAAVAQGAITRIFTDWQRQGLLQVAGTTRKPSRHWRLGRPALIRRWADAFGDYLQPKLVLGRYRLPAATSWNQLALPAAGVWWGGEVAAHYLLDGYLLPEQYSLYSQLPRAALIRHLRLVPDPLGPLQIYQALEPDSLLLRRPRPFCVHPLLAYADLLSSRDARNQEVAQLLHQHYLNDDWS